MSKKYRQVGNLFVINEKKAKKNTLLIVRDNAVNEESVFQFANSLLKKRTLKKWRIIICSKSDYNLESVLQSKGILIVITIVSGESVMVGRGMVSCGKAKILFTNCCIDELYTALLSITSSSNNCSLSVSKTDSSVITEMMYFDEDMLDELTMKVAQLTAPYCANVIVEYAHMPIYASESIAVKIAQGIKKFEWLTIDELIYQPYATIAGKEVVALTVGVKRLLD